MGRHVIAAFSLSATLLFAAAESHAQNQRAPAGGQQRPAPSQSQQKPQQQQQQQQQSAAKPYKAIAVAPPKPIDDPSLEAFRKQVTAVAEKKDRAALAGMVSKSFFWMGDKGDQADKKKSGIDNLAKAIGLDGKDADGWDTLAEFASQFTGGEYSERKGTMCSPGQPSFNDEDFGALVKSTGTEDDDWGYLNRTGIEMRATAQPNAPVIEKLGAHFVRLMEDDAAADLKVPMTKIVAPSGKTGYVPADAVGSLENDEICYAKEGSAWKIVGYLE